MVLVNSRDNPTGSALLQEDLFRIARVTDERDLLVISDVCEKITYDGVHHHCLAGSCACLKAQP